MVEAMTWRGDSTLNTYSVTRSGTGAWNESRAYTYNSRGQLLSEGFSPAPSLSDTLTYVFDGNTPGVGVRTDAKAGTGAPGAWEASATAIDALARVTQDQINAPRHVLAASGVALGADHVDVFIDGVWQGRAVHPGWADPVGAWSMNLNLAAGAHTLTVNAVHPSHQYTATASSTFTVAQSQGGNVTSAYDTDGNVTSRTWDSGLAQTLTWDAFGRLIKVAQRDSANNGYDWSAVYDGLGRRLNTTQQTVTANVASGSATVTTSIYDPQAEFLEIGVAVNGAKAWKVNGPDLNGRYGLLQGTGGLEATIVDAGGATKGVINDQFGNGVASVTGGTVSWFTTRVGAYGPLPGSQVETLTDITRVPEATAWRSRRIDSTGFIYLGARYYEPTSGRFLSADPLGHGASMSLYDYANGDPVNHFDPDGRGKNPSDQGSNPVASFMDYLSKLPGPPPGWYDPYGSAAAGHIVISNGPMVDEAQNVGAIVGAMMVSGLVYFVGLSPEAKLIVIIRVGQIVSNLPKGPDVTPRPDQLPEPTPIHGPAVPGTSPARDSQPNPFYQHPAKDVPWQDSTHH